MASGPDRADEIRQRMAEIRSRLHYEMNDVVTGAAMATDWRGYLRARPWLTVGIAFATGYLLVPRAPRPSPGPATAQPFAPQPRMPERSIPPPSAGLLRRASGFLLPIAARAAQAYALDYAERFLTSERDGSTRVRRESGPSDPDATARGARAGSHMTHHSRF